MRDRVGGYGVGDQGLDRPRVDVAAVWSVVLRLRQVAALAGVAAQELPVADDRWQGAGAASYGRAREALAQHLRTAGAAAGAVAQVLTGYARAVESAQAEVDACRRALAGLAEERERRAALMVAGLGDLGTADLDQQLHATQRQHAEAMRSYAAAVGLAARALDGIYRQVPAAGRGMTVGDRVEQAWYGFGQAAVVDPVKGVWALTGEALVDPAQWAGVVAGMPGALRDQATHPLSSLEEAVGADYWKDNRGDWSMSAGATGGALAGMVLGGGLGKAGHEAGELAEQAAKKAAEDGVEHPPLQDLADTFDHVDLDNHESHGGHTLSKHVHVTDEDLLARLERRLANIPADQLRDDQRDVSRFASGGAAEEWITKTLEARADDIDRWLESGGEWTKEFDLTDVPPDVGILFHVHPDGTITKMQPTSVRVVLARNEHGVVVRTAYPMMGP